MKQRLLLISLPVMLAAAVIAGALAARLHDVPGGTVAGTIVVYTESAFSPKSGNTTWVIAYDLRTKREVRRTPLATSEYKLTSRNEVLYVSPQDPHSFEISRLNPVTGSVRQLYSVQASTAYSFAVSPDGAMLAFSEFPGDQPLVPAKIRVIDLADGSVRTIVEIPDEIDGFRGRPALVAWRNDGRGFVATGAVPGPPGTTGTIMLDGRVVLHLQNYVRVSPSGRSIVVDGVNGVGCILAAPQRVRIIDLDSNLETAAVEDPQRGLIVREWSPDGSALLYTQYRAVAGVDDSCAPEPDPATGRSFVLYASGGAPVAVPDVGALKWQWYGDRSIEFECVNAPVDALDTVFRRCPPGGRTLLVGGHKVANGDIGEVLGFIDLAAQP